MTTLEYLRERQLNPRKILASGTHQGWKRSLLVESFPLACRERPLCFGQSDKVFSSLWLSEHQVLCGTKDNQVLLYDTVVSKLIKIPTIPRPLGFRGEQCTSPRSGMHSLARSPSGDMLAAGGENVRDVAFYRLPSLDPYALGLGHQDWIFALKWLNDDIILSGSRDHRLSVWSLANTREGSVMSPVASYCFADSDLVRDMALCQRKQEVALLSPNGRLAFMNVSVMVKVHTVQTPAITDNVCVTINADQSMYAVGSSDCFLLADTCCCLWRRRVALPCGIQAVRSLAFQDHLLTVGCGSGEVLTYDTRNEKYLGSLSSPAKLVPRQGYMRASDLLEYQAHIGNNRIFQAVYTVAHSPSAQQLFVAGGPLNAPFFGNFASIYQ
ncbi:DDB1- and CUL4-associated factor 12-like protein 2 [Sycon ciliatum]|uniref:DDB1- and CUL4-associated factor 12-like protein 2 n=1 Tax=Sycon ciliatum TaxID=27933 RepID=UPI0020A9BCDC|eukprot:scpid51722/ scgid10133/ DDB1- and CUL4-associated factor 12-like protein 2; WD repeat-containing protein 40C